MLTLPAGTIGEGVPRSAHVETAIGMSASAMPSLSFVQFFQCPDDALRLYLLGRATEFMFP
jgi:hypothetical protein